MTATPVPTSQLQQNQHKFDDLTEDLLFFSPPHAVLVLHLDSLMEVMLQLKCSVNKKNTGLQCYELDFLVLPNKRSSCEMCSCVY